MTLEDLVNDLREMSKQHVDHDNEGNPQPMRPMISTCAGAYSTTPLMWIVGRKLKQAFDGGAFSAAIFDEMRKELKRLATVENYRDLAEKVVFSLEDAEHAIINQPDPLNRLADAVDAIRCLPPPDPMKPQWSLAFQKKIIAKMLGLPNVRALNTCIDAGTYRLEKVGNKTYRLDLASLHESLHGRFLPPP